MRYPRDTVFVSHANPEDNDFSRWLALKIARAGFAVWSDVTSLLGGENFWMEAEDALRQRTIKFIYVLSRVSNHKSGPRAELQVAQGLAKTLNIKDFVIPVRIDDIPFSEINVPLSPTLAIDFERSRADGLASLFKKLENDNTPKHPDFGSGAVSSWWKTHIATQQSIIDEPEEYVSNWFPAIQIPESIFIHELSRYEIGKVEVPEHLPYPGIQYGQYLVSFASSEELVEAVSPNLGISASRETKTEDLLEGQDRTGIVDRVQGRNLIVQLLKRAWSSCLERRKVMSYELSSKRKCFYYLKGQIHKDRFTFLDNDGRRVSRSLVGYRTLFGGYKRFWHYAIEAKPMIHPFTGYSVLGHVVFSDEGLRVWDDPNRMHRARRSECRTWWNPVWRDRLLAFVYSLADQDGVVNIPVSSGSKISLSAQPLAFMSPVSYNDPEKAETALADSEEDNEGQE